MMPVTLFDQSYEVYTRGNGKIPLLIVGPASLFMPKGRLPADWDKQFTLYFIDIFSKPVPESTRKNLTLNDFVAQIDSIRNQLKLEKIALFAHSAPGIIALEYSIQYPEETLFTILIGTMPKWGKYKNNQTNNYFDANASQRRKQTFLHDQRQLASSIRPPSFKMMYNARRSHFYRNYHAYKDIMKNTSQDSLLIYHYFNQIQDYDLNRRYDDITLEKALSKTFIGLGLYDYSCPYYCWTEDMRVTPKNIYVFQSGHFPIFESSNDLSREVTLFQSRLTGDNQTLITNSKRLRSE